MCNLLPTHPSGNLSIYLSCWVLCGGLPEVEESQDISRHSGICLWNHRERKATAKPHTFRRIFFPYKYFIPGWTRTRTEEICSSVVKYSASTDWAIPAPQSPTYLCAYLPTYLSTYISTYISTYQYLHTSIRIVPIVPHPTFSGSHWSSFRYELKSVPVRFGTHWSPFRSVSVPIEVRFGQFRSVLVRSGPFRSVPIRFGKSWYPRHHDRLMIKKFGQLNYFHLLQSNQQKKPS